MMRRYSFREIVSLKESESISILRRVEIGRFQTLLREGEKFWNFEKKIGPCDSVPKIGPMLKF